MGTIIGMAGGAAVGAVIGSQADQAAAQKQGTYQRERARRGQTNQSGSYGTRSHEGAYHGYDQSDVFDSSNSADDRIYDFDGKDYTGDYSAQQPTTSMPSATIEELGANYSYSPHLEILNARFVDDNQDNVLSRNETCKLIFEIKNTGSQAIYDVVPTVVETTGNKHIFISPSVHVEMIAPGSAIRYTAMVKADNRLKEGTARFCVSVIQGGKSISKVNQFDIPTKGKM